MRPPATVTLHDTLRVALERMRVESVRELPVIDDAGRIVGFVDEGALAHVYLSARPPASTRTA